MRVDQIIRQLSASAVLECPHFVEHILIVTPANLTDQWRREMHEKFGETIQVINRATVDAASKRTCGHSARTVEDHDCRPVP